MEAVDGGQLRQARLAAGLSLRTMAGQAGYSVAYLSYAERGAPACPVTPAVVASYERVLGHRLAAQGGSEMRRRNVIAGLAASAVVLPALRGRTVGLVSGLDDALYSNTAPPPAVVAPVSLARLQVMLGQARADFAAVRLAELAAAVPTLVAAATAAHGHAPAGQRGGYAQALAGAYMLGNELAIKLHSHDLAWVLADRAVQAAQACGEPLTVARARWRLAISLRRAKHYGPALQVVTAAAATLRADTGMAGAHTAGAYVRMLCCAAYTAAGAENRGQAYDLIGAAHDAVAQYPHAAVGAAAVDGYAISVARAVGDFDQAVQLAARVRAGALPTVERHARYLEDTAIALWCAGRPTDTYRALLACERVAPQEVRMRPWAQRLAHNLLSARPRTGLDGVRDLAARIGALT